MIKNIFLSLALSSIGLGCYIYFIKKIKNKEEYNEEISDEEIEDLNTPVEESTESDELYGSCEDDILLKDMERYQIVLYNDPYTIFNNWEFIN
jgi:hypothetical protein